MPTDQQLEAEILPGLAMQLINAEASFYADAVHTQAAGKQRGVQVSSATIYLNAFQTAHAPSPRRLGVYFKYLILDSQDKMTTRVLITTSFTQHCLYLKIRYGKAQETSSML